MTDSQHDKVQKQHELQQHEVKQVLDFLKQYGKLIVIGVAAAAVVVIGSKGLAGRKAAKAVAAEEQLSAARTSQQFEDVVNSYKSTPAAPAALLNLARTYFNNGEYFQARAQYDRFLEDYKNSELAPLAEYGIACCTEADGDFDTAADLFKAFISAQDGHYLVPAATIALARSLSEANRPYDARIVLEDFLAANAGGQWAQQANAALDRIEEK